MSGHLPEVSLLEAALGLADSALRHPEVAAHLASCTRCQGELLTLRDQLGEVGLATGPSPPAAAPPPALRQRILAATTSGADSPSGLTRRFARLFELDEQQAAGQLQRISDDSSWDYSGAISFFHFTPGGSLVSRAEAGVIRLTPGTTFPRHRHRGLELGLILTGSLHDESSGRDGLPGDLFEMADGTSHTVRCTSVGSCCFAVLLHGGFPILEC